VRGTVRIGLKEPRAYLFPFRFSNDGRVRVRFLRMKTEPYPPFHRLRMREELMRRLNAIEGISIDPSRLDPRASFPMSALVDEDT
jgi:hypothetical protein